MRVFVTGATGYIGSAVAKALQEAGDEVSGLARSPENVKKLEAQRIHPVMGDLTKPETVAEAARAADGIIHTANTNSANAAQSDIAVVRAILKAIEGTQKKFIYTSGVWVLGSTGNKVANEETPVNPALLVAHRPGLEQEVLGYKDKGVQGIVIRPAVVYGRGGGMLNMFMQSARDSGAASYVGDGQNRWSFVDVDDLAQLYVLALKKAPAGALYNAAHGPSYRVLEIAETASVAAGANGKTTGLPLADAQKTMGPFADALVLDQQISAEKAERELGWNPRARPVLNDLKTGSYARR